MLKPQHRQAPRPALKVLPVALIDRPEPVQPPGAAAEAAPEIEASRALQIGADLTRTVLTVTETRLADAIADYETALDSRATLVELQYLDRLVARAERQHASAHRCHDAFVTRALPSTISETRPGPVARASRPRPKGDAVSRQH